MQSLSSNTQSPLWTLNGYLLRTIHINNHHPEQQKPVQLVKDCVGMPRINKQARCIGRSYTCRPVFQSWKSNPPYKLLWGPGPERVGKCMGGITLRIALEKSKAVCFRIKQFQRGDKQKKVLSGDNSNYQFPREQWNTHLLSQDCED